MRTIASTTAWLLATVFCVIQSSAQSISAVAPSSGTPNQTLDVIIRGLNTGFKNGLTKVQLLGGTGITVKTTIVQDAQTATATLVIDAGASIGDRDIVVTTGSEVLRHDNAFEVFAPNSQFRVNIQAVPVSSIGLSDLDVANTAQSPLIFFCNLYNDNQSRRVRVFVLFSSASLGLLGDVHTDLIQLDALKYVRLTNNNFSHFTSNGSIGDNFLKAVRDKGGLPADEYTYRIEVRNTENQVIPGGTDETVNVVTNPVANPELITPGSYFSEEPDKVFSPQPFFQWFGNSEKYDLALYEYKPGQTEQEAIRGLPVYRQTDIAARNLLYPNYAEKLKEGTTYVWQVTGKFAGSKGTQFLPSHPFRFVYGGAAGWGAVSKISISPQNVALKPGEKYQFKAILYDKDDKPVTGLEPLWQVTPSKGTITKDGLLTAGKEPANIAVLAKAGSATDFATVTVSPLLFNYEEMSINKMLRTIFGLPQK